MATHDYVIDNSTGANVRADINNVLQAILTNNSSSSAPSTTAAYMWWADTTSGILKIRNSANNAWVELLQLDGTLTLEDGSASTPALAFRDDLNTGIFSSAADTFNVATGGVERVEFGTATIFNDTGADVDLRIEGDTDQNLLFCNAGGNAVGIGTSTPGSKLHIFQSSASAATGNSGAGLSLESNSHQYIQYLGVNTKEQGILFGDDADNDVGSIVYNHSDNKLTFATNANMRLMIDSSGRLLLGTTTEGHASADDLTIATSGSTGITIRSGTSSEGNIYFSDGTSGNSEYRGLVSFDHNTNKFQIQNNGNLGLGIDSSGNVGIGTTSPSDKLEIRAGGIYLHSESQASSGALSARLRFLKFHTTTTAAEYEVARIESFTQNGFAGGLDFYFGKLVGSGNYAITQGLRLDHEGTLQIANAAAIAGFASSAVTNNIAPLKIYKSSSVTHSAIQLIWDHFNTTAGIKQKIQFTIGDDASSDGFNNAGYIAIEKADSWQSGSGRSSALVFATVSAATESERMRILSNGNVLIGASNQISKGQPMLLQVGDGNNSFSIQRNNSQNVLQLDIEVGTTSGRTVVAFANPNGFVGSIQTSGSSTSFNTSSDYRLKENEVAISDGITRLKTLKPYRFNFKADPSTILDGFFAHEVTAVPEAIKGTKDEVDNNGNPVHQGLDYGRITPLLTAALQEAITKIEVLETKVAALETA